MDNIFIKTLLADKIKIQPQHINKNIIKVLLFELQAKFEGKCSYHGYIKPSSISIYKYSMGQIQAFSLNGDVVYNVQYHCEVCNPTIGSIVQAKIVNMNKFGILAECSIFIKGLAVSILDIIVPKNSIDSVNEVDVDKLGKGDDINIEVLGKKYELNDKNISVVGRIIKTSTDIVQEKNAEKNNVEFDEDNTDEDDDDDDENENEDEDDDEDDDDEEEEEKEKEEEENGDDEFFGAEDDDDLEVDGESSDLSDVE